MKSILKNKIFCLLTISFFLQTSCSPEFVVYKTASSEINIQGVWQWTAQMGETAKDSIPTSITATSTGHLYVAGYTDGNLPS